MTNHHVDWYGAAGSFGALLDDRTLNLQGYAFATHDRTWPWPAGHMPFFSTMTSDRVLIMPGTPLTTNAFLPTGTKLIFARWTPPLGVLGVETIPTSTGKTDPLSLSYGTVGGADFEDSVQYVHAGEERIVMSVGRPYNDWWIGTGPGGGVPDNNGIYPCFVVLRKTGGVWTYNAAASRTGAQMQASNAGVATDLYRSTTTSTGEAYVGSRNTNEMTTLPQSGHIVVCHYDDQVGIGHRAGVISVMDDNLDLKAKFLVPNVEYPVGHQLNVRPRTPRDNPTSAANAEDFIVAYDVFDQSGTPNPVGVILDGDTNSVVTTPDAATWDITGQLRAVVKLRLPDYTTGVDGIIIGHWETTGNQRGWAFWMNGTGALNFRLSNNGTALTVNQSSTAPSFVDGTEYWVGVEYNTGTGALNFYKANGAETMPALWAGWTLISSHSVTAAVPANVTASLCIGGTGSFFATRITGVVYRAAVYDDGVLVADPNFGPDGSPLATIGGGSYTDSLGLVWTVRGTCRIDGSTRFMIQEFRYNASGPSIVGRSGPFMTGYKGSRVEQVEFDDAGGLWVSQTFSGLFNDTQAIYEQSAPATHDYTTVWPAVAPWINGGITTTADWARIVPASQYAGPAIGSIAAGYTWDSLSKAMYLSLGTAGVIAVGRVGTAVPYTYNYLGQCSTHIDDAFGTNHPMRVVLDPQTRRAWIPIDQNSSGSYPPAAPQPKEQWVVGIDMDFWLPADRAPSIPIEDVLSGVAPVRSESMRWDLLDHDNNVLGELMVDRDEPARIANDGTRAVRRTAATAIIPPRPRHDTNASHFYAEDVDPLTQRVMPWWLYSSGEAFPLGLFVWGDDSRVLWSYGEPRHASFTDLCTNLDQPLYSSVGYDQWTSVYDALIDQCDDEGIGSAERAIATTSAIVSDPVSWAAGRDSRLTVMESLCAMAGFLPPYFNNSGILVCRAAPDLVSASPDFSYGANTVVYPGTAVMSDDILTAPNQYLVVGSSAQIELVGIFDVPDVAPNSFANTGRYRRKTIDVQGLTTQADANAAAAAAYASDSSTYTWLSFDTPVDPRHDTWDIVSFDGVNYRQLGWGIECHSGGTMHHDLRGTYG